MTADDAPLPPPPRPRHRKRREEDAAPAKAPLTVDAIARAALAIVDEEGLDELSMRKVALRLGTGPASLYAHVESKDALLDVLYDIVAAEVDIPDPDPERWQEQIKEVMRSQHEMFRRHRDIAKIAFARVPTGPHALPAMDRLIGLFRSAGLPDRVAGLAPDLTSLYVAAVSLEESLYGADPATPGEEPYMDELREYLAALPPERFPNLVAMADALASQHDDPADEIEERFEFALEVLVRGIASMAQDG